MTILKYIILLFLSLSINAQIEKPYEQIAIDYFANELTGDYTAIKYLIFSGDLEKISPLPYSFCIPSDSISGYNQSSLTQIHLPPHPKIIKKLDFFKKLFTPNNQVAYLYVFRHYPQDDNIVVVVYLSRQGIDDYYSILLSKDSKEVIKECKKVYIE